MTTIEQGGEPAVSATPTRWEKMRATLGILISSRVAVAGLVLVGFWVIVAIFSDNCIVSPACWARAEDFEPTPWLARYSPFEQFRGENLMGPSANHWLGTDRNGRDLWSRLAYGSRTILTLAPAAVIIALIIGGTLGVIAGYYGGLVDEIIMRILDASMAFPQILLYLVKMPSRHPECA